MYQHDLGQRPREVAEQAVAALDLLVALTERIEQPVDGGRQLGKVRDVAVLADTEPVTDGGIGRHFHQFLTEPADALLQPAPRDQRDDDCHGRRRQQ